MVRNNHFEPNKCKLVGWVDKVLDQTLSPKKSWMNLKNTKLTTQSQGHVDHKTRPKDAYKIEPINISCENNGFFLMELLMNLLTMGGRWSYHISNENNNYSRWCMNKFSICWPKVENFKTMWKCHWIHVFFRKETKPMENTFNLLVDLDGPIPLVKSIIIGMEFKFLCIWPIYYFYRIYMQGKQKENNH